MPYHASITIGIDPIIYHVGSLAISWHAVLMILGIVVGIVITLRLTKSVGIPTKSIYISALWIVIFGLIGAKSVHVLDNLDWYGDHPADIFVFWKGGLAWYGALAGGFLGGALYARLGRLSLARLADVVAPGAILGLNIGRIGCTINGDSYGIPTSLPWGLVYTHPNSDALWWVAGHPAPVYEIFWNLIILGVLWRLWGRLKPEGSLFLAMAAMYSFGRFFISWVRAEPSVLGPLHQAHIISLVLFIGAGALLLYLRTTWAQPGDERIRVSQKQTE
jgi:phosphatidylglycerol:prolipoprotein diacylglycerol transferase